MHEEIVDHLDLMIESTELIEKRMSRIRVPEDFVLSADGATMLDAVSMRLQVIGESVRKIQKVDPSFLTRYSTKDVPQSRTIMLFSGLKNRI